LAKREEQIVVHHALSNIVLNDKVINALGGYKIENGKFVVINLPHQTNLIKLLQRIRDESHRFAISYHSTLKTKHQTASAIDTIPGIGPLTRKKIIRQFGSLKSLAKVSEADIAQIIGKHKAKLIKIWLN
jgi:excinuclease ABC subunit C